MSIKRVQFTHTQTQTPIGRRLENRRPSRSFLMHSIADVLIADVASRAKWKWKWSTNASNLQTHWAQDEFNYYYCYYCWCQQSAVVLFTEYCWCWCAECTDEWLRWRTFASKNYAKANSKALSVRRTLYAARAASCIPMNGYSVSATSNELRENSKHTIHMDMHCMYIYGNGCNCCGYSAIWPSVRCH